jgi:hypothetical protein
MIDCVKIMEATVIFDYCKIQRNKKGPSLLGWPFRF